MCLNRTILLAMLVLGMWTSPCAADDADDAVAAYLQEHGLTQLLSVHLEQMLDEAAGETREELILRLASLYVQLLDETQDPTQREELEQRSRRLLRMTDDDGAQRLRLSLLRAQYRPAEEIADQHRLRLASPEDVNRARAILDETVAELVQVNTRLRRAVARFERQLEQARGSGANVVATRLERVRQVHAQSSFLAAWAQYYDGWLNDDSAPIEAAELLFADLLAPETSRPLPEDVSIDLRANEPYARAILGMALCKSQTASADTATRWLELLDHDEAYPALRENATLWKIVVALENDQYHSVQELLSVHAGEIPTLWWRLIASHALEAPEDGLGAPRLARDAVSALAARSELSHIRDLAERYGIARLGAGGFALQYVRGVLAYQQARDEHDSEQPTSDPAINDLYREAESHFAAAVREHDINNYRSAIGPCHLLRGWSLYFLSDYQQARTAFLDAEDHLETDRDEALWMAIVCLDRLVRSGASETMRQEHAALIDRFLADYPDSEHAPGLLLQHAVQSDSLSENQLARLLAVPQSHPSRPAAVQRASQEYYTRMRTGNIDERIRWGEAYLALAAELLELPADSPAAANQLLLNIRRTMEVALDQHLRRTDLARQALGRFEALGEAEHVDSSGHDDEIMLRRIQLALLEDDPKRADELADALWQQDAASTWSRLAAQRVFAYAHAQRERRDTLLLRLQARHGGRMLREFDGDDDALHTRQTFALHAAVADALLALWRIGGETQDGRAALFLYQRLLAVQPRNEAILRHAAELATPLGEHDIAATCWRRLSASLSRGSDAWFEARYELMRTLATLDPDRARRVLAQHVQLYPEYGPEPWNERLRELETTLEEQLSSP